MSTTKKTKSTNAHATVHAHEAKVSSGDSEEHSATPEQPVAAPPTATAGAVTGSAPPTVASSGSGTLAARILQIIAVLDEIPVLLGSPSAPAKPLSIQQRRSLRKMKKGAEAEIPGVLALADQYDLTLVGGGTAEAKADMQLVTTLQPLQARLTTSLSLVGDVIAQAGSRTWDTTTMAYSILARLQKRVPAIQTELDPMATFMATKHKSAPTILRQAEAKTLSSSRAKLKAKKEKEAAADAETATGAAGGQAAVVTQGPAAAVAQSQPVAGAATTNGVTASTASAPTTPANGASHS